MPSLVESIAFAEAPPRRTRNSGSTSCDLPLDEGAADFLLLRRRRAVAGRAPGDDVGDVGARAVEPDRRDHAVEQFSGAADEGEALQVLLHARRLADEHHARLRVAVGEDEVGGGEAEVAALESLERRAELVERGGGRGGFARGHDRGLGGDSEGRRGELARLRRGDPAAVEAWKAGVAGACSTGRGGGGAGLRGAASAAGACESAKRSTGSSDSADVDARFHVKAEQRLDIVKIG